jgi:hypothetical protein
VVRREAPGRDSAAWFCRRSFDNLDAGIAGPAFAASRAASPSAKPDTTFAGPALAGAGAGGIRQDRRDILVHLIDRYRINVALQLRNS